MKEESKLKRAQVQVQKTIEYTNRKIQELGKETYSLYVKLAEIQNCFDKIRNVPSEKKLQYKELQRIRLEWKSQAEKIESDYNEAFKKI